MKSFDSPDNLLIREFIEQGWNGDGVTVERTEFRRRDGTMFNFFKFIHGRTRKRIASIRMCLKPHSGEPPYIDKCPLDEGLPPRAALLISAIALTYLSFEGEARGIVVNPQETEIDLMKELSF